MKIDQRRITPAQRATLEILGRGFQIVETTMSDIRVSCGGDHRVIGTDGSQRRGQHKVVTARPRGRA